MKYKIYTTTKMKNLRSLVAGKNIWMITVALMLIYFSSCAKKISFQTSTVAPAATGTVKVTKDGNKNYAIKISLSNLAQPNRLEPAKNTYVVWMETQNNGTKNIGQINSSTGFLSRKLKASFATVSSFKPEKIFITAENEANIQYPGGQLVLSTNKF